METNQSKIVRVSSFAGAGCALQALGLVSLILAVATLFTVIGPIVFGFFGIWLFIYGRRKSIWLECSNCGGKLANNRIKICPYCKAIFIVGERKCLN